MKPYKSTHDFKCPKRGCDDETIIKMWPTPMQYNPQGAVMTFVIECGNGHISRAEFTVDE